MSSRGLVLCSDVVVEVSGPEPVANTLVRAIFDGWLGGSSHDPSHALYGSTRRGPRRSVEVS